MAWTSPDDLVAQVQRLWDRGHLLTSGVLVKEPERGTNNGLQFPLLLRLRRPSPREIGERFEAVRSWIEALENGSRSRLGAGYEIVWEEVNNRLLGRNKVPIAARLPTRADALVLIGKADEAARFDELIGPTLDRFPVLREWLVKRPLVALGHASDWSRISRLPDLVLRPPPLGPLCPPDRCRGRRHQVLRGTQGAADGTARHCSASRGHRYVRDRAKGFEARYGLSAKPSLVRFRILDDRHAIGGLSDLAVPIEQFACLSLSISRVFVVENEITGLAFPASADGIVVLGLGHAVSLVSSAHWLGDCEVYYWSDIDTHGFAMLDRLRASLPGVRSLLMDRATLLSHRPMWMTEEAPHIATLDRLTPSEAALYADLRFDRFARSVRLEQERISFGWLRRALDRLDAPPQLQRIL